MSFGAKKKIKNPKDFEIFRAYIFIAFKT